MDFIIPILKATGTMLYLPLFSFKNEYQQKYGALIYKIQRNYFSTRNVSGLSKIIS